MMIFFFFNFSKKQRQIYTIFRNPRHRFLKKIPEGDAFFSHSQKFSALRHELDKLDGLSN